MTLPKTLQPYARMIVDFEDQRSVQNGYWVHLKDGWFNPQSETHMIHEDTLAVIVGQLKDCVTCVCVDCVKSMNR